MTFPNTDLVITQPTPFDIWMRIGIYTETPNASLHPSSDFSVWPASVCGTYSTSIEYSYSTLTMGTGSSKSVSISRTPTATHTQLQPSNPSNSLRFQIADFAQSGNDYTDRLETLNATYIQAKSTQFTDERLLVPLPTGIIDWLATQEEIVEKYPYIKDCWLGPKGTGQPTVHVPVMALTVTSSLFLDQAETSAAKSPVDSSSKSSRTMTSTVRTIVTVATSTTSHDSSKPASVENGASSSDDDRPQSTDESQPEDKGSNSDIDSANPTSTVQSEAEVSFTPTVVGGISGEAENTDEQHSTDDDKGQIGDTVKPATATKPQNPASTTVPVIGGLLSVIQSVVGQQEGVSQDLAGSQDDQQATEVGPAAVISTALSGKQPAESVTGFVIGTQTASPGGEAVTDSGSVFSALPSGSGLRVIADGQTSTITDAMLPGVAVVQGSGSNKDYIVGVNTLTAGGPAVTSNGNTLSALPAGSGVRIAANGKTRTVPAATFTNSATLQSGASENEYILAGNTLSAGQPALTVAGVTYSALESGSGIVMMAGDSTSTATVGQAIDASFTLGSDPNSPSPLILPAGSQQLGVSGVDIYTASSAILTAGNGTSDADTTAKTSAAISPNFTGSPQETVAGSSTRGVGDAIMSGLGGGVADGGGNGDVNTSEPQSPSSSSTDVGVTASNAVRGSVDGLLLGGFGMIAFVLVLGLL